MGVTVAQEKMFDILEEIKELIPKHWEEIALNKDRIKLDPDWDLYQLLEDQDLLVWISARNEHSEMVGYLCFICHQNLHYKDWYSASDDVIWLSPEYRHSGVGQAMMVEAERLLKGKGVRIVRMNSKLHFDLDGFYRSLGYTPTERLYTKVID